MKKSIIFLKKELSLLSKTFNSAKIRYEYIEETNLHLIEIKPFELYDDIQYLEAEEKLESLFEQTFPHERFLYLGESQLFEINHITAEFGFEKPIKMGMLKFNSNDILMAVLSSHFNKDNYDTAENDYALAA